MMRHLKMLGLAVIAGLAAMAFVGASSASANIDVCTFSLPTGEEKLAEGIEKLTSACPGGTIHNLLTGLLEFVARAVNPTLKGTITETCEESNTKVKSLGMEGEPTLKGKVETLSFTGNCSPCSTVKVEGLPYTGEIFMEGENYFIKSPGQAKLEGCTFGVSCKFGTTGATLKYVPGTSMSNNEFKAEGEELKLEEGSKFLCGATGKWTANYVVSSPSHWYFFLL